jgi:drug/metabolite transporter (DMT)-like permease
VIYVAATAAIRGADAVKAEANRSTLLAGLGMFTAYGLVLAALERGSAAGVAAVRECSVVIAAGLAAAFLKEPLGRGRLAGAMLVAGGVATIALG